MTERIAIDMLKHKSLITEELIMSERSKYLDTVPDALLFIVIPGLDEKARKIGGELPFDIIEASTELDAISQIKGLFPAQYGNVS